METPITAEQNNRHDFWQGQMAAWRQSGLSGAKFCQANDLTYSQFVYWRQKIHKEEAKSADQEQRGGFAQVLCRPAHADSLSLLLPNGWVLRGICSDNIAVVRELLEKM